MESNLSLIEKIKQEAKELFQITDESELDYISEFVPDNNTESKPEENEVAEENGLAQVELGQDFPGEPRAVFIRNLKDYPINVTYKRTNLSSGQSGTASISIASRGREHIGYHCHRATYSPLCSVYISTEIVTATRA